MKINTESLEILLKYAGLALLILLLVFVIAVLTPKLSKIVEKSKEISNKPHQKSNCIDDRTDRRGWINAFRIDSCELNW